MILKMPGKNPVDVQREVSLPIRRGTDSKGSYYQWGNSGKNIITLQIIREVE
jgi:hypothetical protein